MQLHSEFRLLVARHHLVPGNRRPLPGRHPCHDDSAHSRHLSRFGQGTCLEVMLSKLFSFSRSAWARLFEKAPVAEIAMAPPAHSQGSSIPKDFLPKSANGPEYGDSEYPADPNTCSATSKEMPWPYSFAARTTWMSSGHVY